MPHPLRVGVVGVGQIGSRHAQIYAGMPGVRVAAVCDLEGSRARQWAETLHGRALTDYRKLAGLVDAASLAVPTRLHGPIGRWLLAQMLGLFEQAIYQRLECIHALWPDS